jgi:Prenyltransferase and squalene oxidase repeat
VGVIRLVAGLLVALAAAATAAPAADPPVVSAGRYLVAHQAEDGGFAEAGRRADAQLTAWAALGLVAADTASEARARALAFLRGHEVEIRSPSDRALHALARAALGDRDPGLIAQLLAYRPGAAVNTTIWTMLALRAAGEGAPAELVRSVLAAQARSGGWSWSKGVAADSNDTAAALEALSAAGVRGRAIDRGLSFLTRQRRPDGGVALVAGRASDSQSTAWAIQAYLATGRSPGAAAYRFLARMRRPDGGYRYSAAYATTPVWVTAQVLPALARRPFPLGPA